MNGFELILPFLRPIQHMILDPEISEIMVNGPEHVFIERAGRIEEVQGLTLSRGLLKLPSGTSHSGWEDVDFCSRQRSCYRVLGCPGFCRLFCFGHLAKRSTRRRIPQEEPAWLHPIRTPCSAQAASSQTGISEFLCTAQTADHPNNKPSPTRCSSRCWTVTKLPVCSGFIPRPSRKWLVTVKS
jgi:hypothetical protein